ncbi:MAG: DNRLRE domain-containing protein [Terriglobales bacterium]
MKTLTTQTRLLSLLSLILLAWTVAYGQITPSQDSFTNTAAATTNYGSNVLLDVDGAKEIIYIQFNLASIPPGASVSQATLKLYVNAVSTAGSFNVDYVSGSWQENTIDASNAPPLGASIASNVSITTADKNQYILINITSALQAWLNGSETNDGIALVANNTFNASFDSKESKTTSHPPELDVVFAGSGGGITGIQTASGSGLIGGGTSGTLNLSLTNACAANQVLQWNGTSWICASVGTGTITGVTAGTDLTGGGTNGNVTLSLNTSATNALYAQLAASNTFTGAQTINNNTFITGANSSGVLQVTNTLTSGSAPAVSGTTNSTNASGLKGLAPATTGTSNGVFGSSSSTAGIGVKGSSPNIGVYGATSGAVSANYGVQGVSSGNGAGVAGTGTSISGVGGALGNLAGVWGDTTLSGSIFAGGMVGTADNAFAGKFLNSSNNYPTLYLQNTGSGGTGAVLRATGQSGICNIDEKGDIDCTGTMTSVVATSNGARRVSLHAVQAPEDWFEDAGSGQLANGSASVTLDPAFAETVNTGVEYHVFVTPNGDCKGLYVSQKSTTSFDVRELGGGTSSIAFDYRIMAKRTGYEKNRLEDVTEQYQNMENEREQLRERVEESRAKTTIKK